MKFPVTGFRFSVIIVAMVLLAGCKQPAAGDTDVDLIRNPLSAEGYDSDTKLPVMTFDTEMHDFGRLSGGETISYSFHFRNTGEADLIISSTSATCGCTVADYPRGRIAPGGEGYVTVTFKSAGKAGQQYQEVVVVSNAQPSRVRLKITAQVGR